MATVQTLVLSRRTHHLMLASELIMRLQSAIAGHGDKPVLVEATEAADFPPCLLAVCADGSWFAGKRENNPPVTHFEIIDESCFPNGLAGDIKL